VKLTIAVTVLIAALAISIRTAPAAIVSGASIVSRGGFVELRFALRGPRPIWHLKGERQQLTITLEKSRLAVPADLLAGQTQSPVTAVRAAAANPESVQIVIEVAGKVDYAAACIPHDLVVRFAAAGAAPDLAAPIVINPNPGHRALAKARHLVQAPADPFVEDPAALSDDAVAAAVPAQVAAARPMALQRPRPGSHAPLVVIDPGHGGYDPGTRSARGVAEKDLALALGTRLAHALEGLGVMVRLTRSDDSFLSLAERTRLANRESADLFISIHLNSSPTSGIETFYLNNTTDRATVRLAQMENGVESRAGDRTSANLSYILSDLRQGDKANESVALAQMIQAESVAAASRAAGGEVADLGARKGPFFVLVGAEMPAVLVECGFLSNAAEAQRLADVGYQQALADGIAAAVIQYMSGGVAVGDL
jgi:N-acetylmuramoyl-L-alanine amidase